MVIEDHDREVIPDHKLVLVAFDKAEPAFFLCGLLNSVPVGLFVRSYAVQTSISGHVFDYVALPQYDSKDASHRKIVRLARDCHKADGAKLESLEAALDEAVAITLGIPTANLTIMRDELQLLRGGGMEASLTD